LCHGTFRTKNEKSQVGGTWLSEERNMRWYS
jgi:hypothetical protein